jgi:hypothetical protein
MTPGFRSSSRLDANRLRMTLAFLLPFALATVCGAAEVHEGSIRGTVLGDDGSPIADAHVYAEVMQRSKILTVLNANTDDLGIFVFSDLDTGEYHVYADKAEIGYLSTRPDIFTAEPPRRVVLTPNKRSAATVIRFRPKAGIITGWVRDSATGRPVAAHLSLAPSSDGRWSTAGTSGQFRFRLMIPADTTVKFGGCAEGYKVWSYADPSNPSRPVPLQLRSGAELKIDINLERNLENAESSCSACTY